MGIGSFGGGSLTPVSHEFHMVARGQTMITSAMLRWSFMLGHSSSFTMYRVLLMPLQPFPTYRMLLEGSKHA